MRLHVLQHVSFEGPGIIAEWGGVNGHEVSVTRLFDDGAVLPDRDTFDCLVVMGGPMGVNDEEEFPWLAAEKELIAGAIEAGRAVLGICLGAQLVASALGARVRRNQHREIGWAPIWLTEEGLESEIFSHIPEELEVFHWHGDTFDIPEGAVNLAQSAGCHHQAFLYGKNVIGIQFHLEVTRKDVMAMLEHSGEDLTPDAYVQAPAKILAKENPLRRANHALRGILLRLVGPGPELI
jgi:GMP synthase-like glutamine amidotransferase